MSSSPVPIKTRRVGQRCTLNLSRAEMSSHWCGEASNAKADLESQEVSNMDTNHEENRNFDVDVESLTCNTSIRDAALQLMKLSNRNSNQEENKWKLASKDNEEIPVDTEVIIFFSVCGYINFEIFFKSLTLKNF
ncbi:hypothetical protein TNCV_3221881 [Trichonephila clavipes]|nr:hypothetical protein TNCV_3221881 [Trichonephila clavipes]